jgi:hypothetical protein
MGFDRWPSSAAATEGITTSRSCWRREEHGLDERVGVELRAAHGIK